MNVLVFAVPEPRVIQPEAYLDFWGEGVSNHSGHRNQKIRTKKSSLLNLFQFISII